MTVSLKMRCDEIPNFIAKLPADKVITVSFDDNELADELKKQQFMSNLYSLRGSVKADLLSGLLSDRQADRQAEHANDN